jgi:Ca-activated chloride channel homolog
MQNRNSSNRKTAIAAVLASGLGLALVHCSSQSPENQGAIKPVPVGEVHSPAVPTSQPDPTETELLSQTEVKAFPKRDQTANTSALEKAKGAPATRAYLLKEAHPALALSAPKPSPAPVADKMERRMPSAQISTKQTSPMAMHEMMDCAVVRCEPFQPPVEADEESYKAIQENGFLAVNQHPLSTFSIDVDNASYANMRRFLNQGQLPPADAVRIEELINYFPYPYSQPKGDNPISLSLDMGKTPWNPKSNLVLIGLKTRELAHENLPAQNLTFLIDVSGSMQDPNKLPLLKKAFGLLIDQLRPQDQVALVVYAGAAGVVLNPTSGTNKEVIRQALERLEAGGSTAGGAGLRLAYQVARESFRKGGNNRVLIATDGDFNVGESSDESMEKLIVKERQSGIFLSVLGFGMGNYKDSKMEILADKGNGNYAYIDNFLEARKVFVEQMGGTLQTVAKDVKLQIEWNPARVSSYRLIGYENRLLRDEDFNDDTKDAGEMGAGHTVTALYEIIPAGMDANPPSVDPLKYGSQNSTDRMDEALARPAKGRGGEYANEVMTVKFRYKAPQGSRSELFTQALKVATDRDLSLASESLRFTAAVAGFGMLLRQSAHAGSLTMNQVIQLAQGAKSFDPQGYRAECIRLMELAKSLQGAEAVSVRD